MNTGGVMRSTEQ